MHWYQRDFRSVLKEQKVSLSSGLNESDVEDRRLQFGPNQLNNLKHANPLKIFAGQFKDILIIILLVAAVASLAAGLIKKDDSSQGAYTGIYQQNQARIDDRLDCGRATLDYRTTDQYCGNAEAFCSSDSVYVSDFENECKQTVNAQDDSHGAQEAVLILLIVLAIAGIGFINEYKAEKTVESLKELVVAKTRVVREGTEYEIDSRDLVPGDIVLLVEGRKVPADMRLCEVHDLRINESSLTGESLPVAKSVKTIVKDAALGDQKNMAFAGTIVVQGTATGVVIATAGSTEVGKIANLVDSIELEETPMQKKLDILGKRLGVVVVLICTVVFISLILFSDEARNQDATERIIFAFTAAVALAVAAIPEGLAFVVRISLALGARRMAARNALVKRLSAVEALGSTDVICSDKTGTLTYGEMTVRELVAAGTSLEVTGTGYSLQGTFRKSGKDTVLTSAHRQLLLVGALCNDACLNNGSVIGDPTEGALLVSAAKAKLSYESVQEEYMRLNEVPFTSARKFMSTVHKHKQGFFIASKGSLEATLSRCTHMLDAKGKVMKLTEKDREQILKYNDQLAVKALRVLAFAQKQLKTEPVSADEIENGLVFIGLQAMIDPPRQAVVEVVHRVQVEAGMRVIMITGDYIETAKAIAAEIGIEGQAISGIELDMLTQEEFEDRVEQISVYARVNPEHKIRIIQALKKHGHQVAMTGDGVNDAPAIKAADIGIAMGITGSDASKEAADLILLDDQFLTIINAIEEGRGIFDNVRKFVNFLISCNIAEIIAVLLGIILFNNLLFTAVQLLFINIVTDGLPALALGSDPTRDDALHAKPRQFQGVIITKRIWAEIFIFGFAMSAALLAQYWYNINHEGPRAAVSAAFTAIVVYELVRLVDIRSDFKMRWFSNPLLSIAMAASFAVQFAVLYTPFLAKTFGVGPLSMHDWLFIGMGSVTLFVCMKILNPLLDSKLGLESGQST